MHDPAPLPAEPRHNIVLVGMMGTGKSTVGRQVAASLRFGFLDTDDLIVEYAGMSIPEIFRRHGEPGFRDRETAVLESLASLNHHVVATGGGIVLRPRNRALLAGLGFVIWLTTDLPALLQRLGRSRDRPLMQVEDRPAELTRLLSDRAPLYREVADLTVDTSTLTLDETAHGIVESAQYHFATRR